MPLFAFAWLRRVGLLRLVACSLLIACVPCAASSSPSCNPALQCCSYTVATGSPCGVQNTGTGHPINLVNGNKYKAEVDMPALPGVLGLELVRHYNSEYSRVLPHEASGKARNSNIGVLGRGWRLNYDRRILWQGENTPRGDLLTLIEGDGRRLLFTRTLRDAWVFEGRGDAAGQMIRVRPATERAMLPAHVGWHYEWLSRGGVGGGLREHFDARGWMVARMAPTGEALTVRRNTVGWPLQITDPQGRQLTLHYLPAKETQANRQLSASQHRFSGVQHIDTPVGRFSYHYGGSDVLPTPAVAPVELAANLRSVVRPDQTQRRYHHEDPRWPTLLTGISRQGERESTYLYDAQGRAVLSVLGHPASLQRDAKGQLLKPHRLAPGTGLAQVYVQWPEPDRAVLINALGQTTTYQLTSIHGQWRITEARGPGCDRCSPGNTRYRFDKDGQLLEQTRITPQGEPVAGMRWQYDVTGRVVAEQTVRYVREQANLVTQHVTETARYAHAYRRDQDHQGHPVLSSVAPQIITRPSVVAGKWQETHMAYNDRGQTVSITQKGWRPAVAPGESPQPIERTTAYRYSLINGRSVLVEVDGPLPNGPQRNPQDSDITRYEWDARGSYVVRAHHPMGLAERFERDAAGRVIRHVPADGVPVAYGYAFDGEPTSWQRGPAKVQVGYDMRGRLQSITMPDGDKQSLGHEPNTGAVAMANRHGQAHWLVPPMQHQALPKPTPYALTDAWPGQRAWVDDWGRLVALQTQVSGLETRQYDANDRIVGRQLADGTHWRWARDALGRIIAHDVSRPSSLPQRTTLHYAGVHLVRVAHPQEIEHLTHDALGRLQTRTIHRAALRYTERYDYDAADRLTVHHLPEGGSLYYTWGVGRQLKAIEHDDGHASAVLGETLSAWLGWGRRVVIEPLQEVPETIVTASTASSDAHLLRAQLQAEQGYRWGNGVALRWRLNEAGQLTSMRYTGTTNSRRPPQALIDLSYAHDTWGRMSQRQQDGIHTGYAYDAQGRLLLAQSMPTGSTTGSQLPPVEYYAYDDQGHMQASQVMTRDQDWRQVRTQRNATGLPLRMEGGDMPARVLRYSADRRLIEVRQGGTVLASYGHNTHGQRISKVMSDGRDTQFLWSQGQLVGETVPQDTKPATAQATNEPTVYLARRYVYAHGVPVAVVDHAGGAPLHTPDNGLAAWVSALWRWISTPAPTLTSVHTNEIGTPIAATDASGKLVWRAHYSAYGLIKTIGPSDTASTLSPHGFNLNLRLPGQYFDAETGWHDNGLRTYDPQLGQYLEPDPLGPVPNWHSGRVLTQPYAYANHNPLIYADPTGLILFAFDGTGNSAPAPGADDLSNVRKFFLAYDQNQNGRAWYMNGIGRDDPDSGIEGGWVQQGNGATGYERVGYMLEQLDNYMKNNAFAKGELVQLDIVGFSRGAAMARDFANKVTQRLANNAYKGSKACGIELRFLGLWDSVAQFGLNGAGNGLWQLDVPVDVKHVFHAVALNEHRDLFPGERISRGVERGFIGSHADIGGSYGTGDLSDVALNWMVQNARNSGIVMSNWGDNGTQEAWGVVTNPVLHDKSQPKKGAPEDRELYFRANNEIWADRRELQRQATIGGKTWLDTQKSGLITYYQTSQMDADGVSRIVGKVNMQQYQTWLKSYGLEVPYQ